jgi:hypothetical protein
VPKAQEGGIRLSTPPARWMISSSCRWRDPTPPASGPLTEGHHPGRPEKALSWVARTRPTSGPPVLGRIVMPPVAARPGRVLRSGHPQKVTTQAGPRRPLRFLQPGGPDTRMVSGCRRHKRSATGRSMGHAARWKGRTACRCATRTHRASGPPVREGLQSLGWPGHQDGVRVPKAQEECPSSRVRPGRVVRPGHPRSSSPGPPGKIRQILPSDPPTCYPS